MNEKYKNYVPIVSFSVMTNQIIVNDFKKTTMKLRHFQYPILYAFEPNAELFLEGEEELMCYLQTDPHGIWAVNAPTAKMIEYCFLNSSFKVQKKMKQDPSFYHMTRFFENNPHLLLAEEVGLLDE